MDKCEQLLTVRAVAERLCLSQRTVYRLIRSGELPAVKLRGSTRIKESSLAQLIDGAVEVPSG